MPSSADVAAVEVGELLGREVVVRPTVDDARQAGVRQHADRQRGVLAEVAQVLLHLGRAGGAVDAEDVGTHRRDGHDGRADLAADEHAARRLHRHLHLDRDLAPDRSHRPATADHRRLDLQQVHARLDEEEVDAADEQAVRLFLVGVAQLGEADVAEARQLRAGPDRAGDEAGPAVGGVVVGDLAGDARRGDVEVVGAVGDVVLGEHGREAAEAGRLDGVDADVEERRVHAGDDVGTGQAQHLVAALERGAAEVVGGQVESLHVRAERAVEHDDAPVHCLEVGLRRHGVPRLPADPGSGREGCGLGRPRPGAVSVATPDAAHQHARHGGEEALQ